MLEGINQLFTHPFPPGTIGMIALVVFVLSIFIDISKIKLNPWKRVLKGISSVFNSEIIKAQRELQAKIDETCHIFQEKYNELSRQFEDTKIESLMWQKRAARRRIIEFGDECRRGEKHSQQMFVNIFNEIGEYEELCEKTRDPNHVITESIQYIRETYQQQLAKNDFV